jgi:hypothetical protein
MSSRLCLKLLLAGFMLPGFMLLRSLPISFRVAATDDAGKPARVLVRPFAPWSVRKAWGVPEVALPLVIFSVALCGVVVLAGYQGPWVVAVLLFSPMATTWIGAVIFLAIWGMKAWPRQLVRSRAAALYRDGACPSCSYDLRNAAPMTGTAARQDRNGTPLVTCPECGAAWCLEPPGPTQRMTVRVRSRDAEG